MSNIKHTNTVQTQRTCLTFRNISGGQIWLHLVECFQGISNGTASQQSANPQQPLQETTGSLKGIRAAADATTKDTLPFNLQIYVDIPTQWKEVVLSFICFVRNNAAQSPQWFIENEPDPLKGAYWHIKITARYVFGTL